MITKEEIKHKSSLLRLESATVEKDYVLGWFLQGIAQHPLLSTGWILKGGTCLRKCYFENYRFSEDLDFTVLDHEHFTIEHINKNLASAVAWVSSASGIEIDLRRSIFEEVNNPAGQKMIQGRLYFRGPVGPSAPRQWPRIKFDLTPHERVVFEPVQRSIFHNYSDQLSFSEPVLCYEFHDIFSEKIRALFERTRPRDLYDVVEMSKAVYDAQKLKLALKEKCRFKSIHALQESSMKMDACQNGWENQLSHQLSHLVSFKEYYGQFKEFYDFMGLDQLLVAD